MNETRPTKEQIYEELNIILGSEYFSSSERMGAFLRYLVVETVEGRADRIKSYSIAVEVFERDTGFDATLDGIVRTSAHRLRIALDRFNRNEDNKTGVQITIPKGRYVPLFTDLLSTTEEPVGTVEVDKNEVPEARIVNRNFKRYAALGIGVVCVLLALLAVYATPKISNTTPQNSPALVVTTVSANETQPAAHDFAKRLSSLIVLRLSAYGNVRVIDNQSGELKLDNLFDQEGSYYILKIAVQDLNGSLSIVWRIDDAATKTVLWASEERLEDPDVDTAADVLAGRILGLEGALPTHMSSVYQATEELGCIVKSQRLALFYLSALQDNVRTCLEAIVSKRPSHAVAWAILAQNYYRLSSKAASYGEDTADLDKKLQEAAMKADDLSPNSILTKQALMYYSYNSKNISTFNSIARAALSKYQDPHLKMWIGTAFVNIGLVEEGVELLEKGISESGDSFSLAYSVLAGRQYFLGNYESSLDLLKKVGTSDYYQIPLIRAVSLAQLGRLDEAKAAVSQLHSLRPNYEQNLYRDLRHGNVSEEVIDSVARGLELIGLTVQKVEAR